MRKPKHFTGPVTTIHNAEVELSGRLYEHSYTFADPEGLPMLVVRLEGRDPFPAPHRRVLVALPDRAHAERLARFLGEIDIRLQIQGSFPFAGDTLRLLPCHVRIRVGDLSLTLEDFYKMNWRPQPRDARSGGAARAA